MRILVRMIADMFIALLLVIGTILAINYASAWFDMASTFYNIMGVLLFFIILAVDTLIIWVIIHKTEKK